jgi:hypothetical protein
VALSSIRGSVRLLPILLVVSVPACAQTRQSARPSAPTAQAAAESVVYELRQMQLAGLSDEVMIDYIKSRGQNYVLTA